MKKLLIVTGPQGSGNHLFARLFSLHENVIGWEKLHEKYWVPSAQEPNQANNDNDSCNDSNN